jgi:hypothetical protein
MLQHCYRRADRQGLMLVAMLALGVYNGFRWAAALTGTCMLSSVPAAALSSQLTCPACPMLQGG